MPVHEAAQAPYLVDRLPKECVRPFANVLVGPYRRTGRGKHRESGKAIEQTGVAELERLGVTGDISPHQPPVGCPYSQIVHPLEHPSGRLDCILPGNGGICDVPANKDTLLRLVRFAVIHHDRALDVGKVKRLVLFAHRVEGVSYALDRREAEFALHKLFSSAIQREAVDVGVEVRHVAPPHLLDLAFDYRSFCGCVTLAQDPLARLQTTLPICRACQGRMVIQLLQN